MTPDGDNTDCWQCGADVQPTATFCPHCGTAVACPECRVPFVDSTAFCSNCGAERHAGDSRLQTNDQSETYRQFRRRIRRYLEDGWEVTADHGDHITVVNRGIGSLWVHLLLVVFSGGFLNLVYGWYHYSKNAETRHLVVGETDPACSTTTRSDKTASTQPATNRGWLRYLTAGLLWAGSLMCLFVAVSGGSLGIGLVGLLLAAAASGSLGIGPIGVGFSVFRTYILPPLRRRLGITRFGRYKTVDQRLLESTDEPCVVCGFSFDGGVVRRRRDETVLAGVPVRTHRVATNHYCPACARDEQLIAEPAGAEHTKIPDQQSATTRSHD